jgi:hypothetical protein
MTTVLAVAAIAFASLCVACLVVLHVAPTGYSPLRNAVSEYGVGRSAWWYRAQAACAGVAAVFLGAALALAAFASISWAAATLPATEHGTEWLGRVMGLTALGTVLGLRTTFLRPYVGLIERGFYAAFLAWIFLVSSRLAGA